uniref:Uncharacterized protein n=1 Tax=viral metagenome TaxID=1070528 RepID=A0A6M3LCV5_9ZZZZ
MTSILQPKPKSIVTPAHEEAARLLRAFADGEIGKGYVQAVMIIFQTSGGKIQSQVMLGDLPWASLAMDATKHLLLHKMVAPNGKS